MVPERRAVVPLLTGATSALWHSSHAGAGILCTFSQGREFWRVCSATPTVGNVSAGWGLEGWENSTC